MYRRLSMLNGMAIIAVLLSHAAEWGQIALMEWTDRFRFIIFYDYVLVSKVCYPFLIIIRQICAFCVPVFLMVTGYFVSYAFKEPFKSVNTFRFVRKRTFDLFIPYFFWSVLLLVIEYLQNGQILSPGEFYVTILTGGVDIYFFAPLLIYCYLFAPILALLANNHPKLLFILTFILHVSILAIKYAVIAFDSSSRFIIFLYLLTPWWSVARWVFYFVMGILLGYHFASIKDQLVKFKKIIPYITLAAGIMYIIESQFLFRISNGYEWRLHGHTFTGVFYSVAFFLCFTLYETERFRFAKQLSWLGSKTYGIYLMHNKVYAVVAKLIFLYFPFILPLQFFFQPILLFSGLSVCLLCMMMLLKTRFRRIYPYIFG